MVATSGPQRLCLHEEQNGASLLHQRKRKKIFFSHSRVFLLDFLFQDQGILSRKRIGPEVVPEGHVN